MDSINQPSRLLRLPREIRDLIFEYVLLQGTIVLEPAVTKAPQSRIAVGGEVGFCDALYQMYRLIYPLAARSTWTVHLNDLAVPEEEFQLDSTVVHLTYQLASPANIQSIDKIDTALMQVCKQIYCEATKIFYSENTFAFTADFRIPTAAAFLRDRPATSLRLITSLELNLMELEEIRPQNAYSGRLLLQYGHELYAELCALLASPKMNLRSLYLTVETVHKVSSRHRFPVSEAVRCDDLQWMAAEDKDHLELADWVQPLLGINTLDHLSIFWVQGTHIRLLGKTIALMRHHMLKRSATATKGQTHQGPEATDILYRSIETSNNEEQSCAVVTYTPVNHGHHYRECAIRDDGRKLIEIPRGEQQDNVIPDAERPIVQEYLETFAKAGEGVCTTWYCEFHSD